MAAILLGLVALAACGERPACVPVVQDEQPVEADDFPQDWCGTGRVGAVPEPGGAAATRVIEIPGPDGKPLRMKITVGDRKQ
jgi:hypothetical protein